MTPEQEKLLVTAAENLEKFLGGLVVGLEKKDGAARRWYTPTALFLRMMKIGAEIAPTEFRLILGCLHGCVDLFGFAGSVKLAIEMRKTINARQKRQRTQNPLP